MIAEILILIISYLIGSIPSGFLIARLAGIADIRAHGSGNIGATNVARVLGKHYFVLVFVADMLKAYAWLTLLAHCGYATTVCLLAAGALLIGNGCSIFLRGSGGKGVATSFGILLTLNPPLLCCAALSWFFMLWYTKVVGIASVVILLIAPFCSWLFLHDDKPMVLFVFCMAAWGLFLHRNNIKGYLRLGDA
ncbi:MAG: glycerol-3-phosphate acyltransferase [Candidatus Babeliales bacterium]